MIYILGQLFIYLFLLIYLPVENICSKKEKKKLRLCE